MTTFLLSVSMALGISFLCSLFEATLLSLPATYVANMRTRHPATAEVWRQFKANIEKPIAVILIANTAAHTIGATIAGAQFELLFGDRGLVIFSILFTYLMLQFTEILPKTLGVRYNRPLSLVMARPLSLLVRVLSPALTLVHYINRPFQRKAESEESVLEEIVALASAAKQTRSVDIKQAQMILAASRLSDLRVHQIMTPRTRVTYLRVGEAIEEILDTVQNSPFTRLPLCEKDLDHIVGLVHIRDLFMQLRLVPGKIDVASLILAAGHTLPEAGPLPGSAWHVIGSGHLNLQEIRRDVLYFPSNMPVQKALHLFQTSRTHLAVVLDEYGATEGIVTLEDILEEIVGKIEDEFDIPVASQLVAEGSLYRVKADVAMRKLKDYFGLPDDVTSAVETVGGYVAMRLGKIPKIGDSVDCGRYKITVTVADARMVSEVVFEEIPPANGESATRH